MTATPVSAWRPSAQHDPLVYPGRIPADSFVLADGMVTPRSADAMAADGLLANRTAVLAVGSNAAPARLADKCGSGGVVPVVRTTVVDHVAAYSAHITTYGAIAATLLPDPGSSTELFVAFFDEGQLAAVDRSEGNYGRPELAAGTVPHVEGPVYAYESQWGPLRRRGSALRVAAFASTSRLPSADQPTLLGMVADRLGVADARALADAVRAGTMPRAEVRAVLAHL